MKVTVETRLTQTLRGEVSAAELLAFLRLSLAAQGHELPPDASARFWVYLRPDAVGVGAEGEVDEQEPLRFTVSYTVATTPQPVTMAAEAAAE